MFCTGHDRSVSRIFKIFEDMWRDHVPWGCKKVSLHTSLQKTPKIGGFAPYFRQKSGLSEQSLFRRSVGIRTKSPPFLKGDSGGFSKGGMKAEYDRLMVGADLRVRP